MRSNMKDSLLDALRKTTIGVAVDTLSSIHEAKRLAQEHADTLESEEGGALQRPAVPSPTKLAQFLGDVAHLGLDQVNGVLKLKARYGDDATRWLTDYLFPKRAPRAPKPAVHTVSKKAGETVEVRFMVENHLSRPQVLSFEGPSLKTADGADVPSVHHTISPATLRLDAGQPWLVVLELGLSSSGKPLAAGRYVGFFQAKLGEHPAQRLLLDITVEA